LSASTVIDTAMVIGTTVTGSAITAMVMPSKNGGKLGK
jgi:hypothetical protein